MPRAVGEGFDRLLEAQDQPEFLGRLEATERAIREHLATFEEESRINQLLPKLVEADFSEEERQLLTEAARKVYEGLFPGQAVALGLIANWVENTHPPSLRWIAKEMEELGLPFSPNPGDVYKEFFQIQVAENLLYGATSKHLGWTSRAPGKEMSLDRVVISRKASGSPAAFVGEAAHEFVHRAILLDPVLSRRFERKTLSEWVTESTESIVRRWPAAQRGEGAVAPLLSMPTPAMAQWLYHQGWRIAQTPTQGWERQIRAMDQHFSAKDMDHAIG